MLKIPLTKQSEKVDVDSIDIEDGRRLVHPDSVDLIAKSISMIGLRTPISVRYFADRPSKDGTPDSYILISGAHRLAAAKQLGWASIECFVLNDEPDDQAKLWEIAENLHRAELTALERSELMEEWGRLADKVGQSAQPPGGIQPADKGISKASRELCIERTEYRRGIIKIASLTPEAKKVAIEVGLDDNKSALLAAKDKSGDAAKEIENLRAERARRDAEKQRKAERAKSTNVVTGHLGKTIISNIMAAGYHLEDAVHEAKRLKPKCLVPRCAGTDL